MMRTTIRRLAAATALVFPLMFGLGTGTAAAAPQTSLLQIPVIGGLEFGPIGVPGGSFQTIPIRATVGEAPGEVRFAAADPEAYYFQYEYRWMAVQWLNLTTGATGVVDFRHWDTGEPKAASNETYGRSLPADVVAKTGPGPIAVAATQVRDYASAFPTTLVPGLGIVSVP